jgi:outer membrane protein OmpA-like peptidoglycan-associated protein
LAGKGIAADRVETASGGEGDPADTNATAGGRFENRRTELVVLSR